MATIFTSPTCQPCKKVKEYLRNKGVAFVEKDITENPNFLEEVTSITGMLQVPVVVQDDMIIVGYSPRELDKLI